MEKSEKSRARLDVSSLVPGIATLSLVLYVSGFIVLNSHLASFGIQSFALLEPRYVMAGGLLFLTLGIYTAFAGRRVFYLDHDIQEFSKLGRGSRFSTIWEVFAGIHVITEALFGTVFAAWLIGGLLAEKRPSDLFFAVGGSFFLFDYALVWSGFYKRNPKAGARIAFLLHFMVVFLFFLLSEEQLPRDLFWAFVGLSLVLNLLLDLRNRIGQSESYRIFEAGWVLFTVLLFSLYFGSSVYGRVRTSLGGGKPQPVRLILTDADKEKLSQIRNKNALFSKKILLVAENENEVILRVPNNAGYTTVRLRKDAVVAIISDEEE